jgi:hypothetical protein
MAPNGGGSPPGCVSCGVCCEGGGTKLLLGARNSPLFTNAASTSATGRQPRLLRCNWRTTPAPGTHDRLSSARSRPTLALSSRAHGAGSDSKHQSPGRQLVASQPPIRDSSEPADSVTIALLASCARLAFSLGDPEKAHWQECHSHNTAAVPHDSLMRYGRFREITSAG